MAFPGTYNFSYYKGDTLEFRVYPKDSSGAAFDLTGYDNLTSPLFTIATERGAESVITAYSEIVGEGANAHLLCTIRPQDGEDLSPGTSYVYDIEINKPGDDYNFVFTILTGTISVTEQVGVSDLGES